MTLVVSNFKFLFFAALLLFGAGCDRKPTGPELANLSGPTMGTSYHIKFVRSSDSSPAEKVHQQIKKRLQAINAQMSTYQQDSNLSLFNHDLKKKEGRFPEELRFVIKEALRIGKASYGALDVTIGPVVELWGFGANKSKSAIPTAKAIRLAKAKTGLEKILFQDQVLKVTDRNLQIDLSSIAKGYAVDAIAELLSSQGFTNYLVEIGGEIRTGGSKIDLSPWIVGIEKPDEQGRSLQRKLPLTNLAMATSGDYRNYFKDQGKKYSHMLDPTTGRPITHNMASVSVIHPSCMTADGWATAFMVLGPKKAMKIAIKNELALLMLVKEGEHFQEKMSPAFKKLLSQTNQSADLLTD